MEKLEITSDAGFIQYSYFKPDKSYPQGLILFLGSYINTEFRGKGKFKELVAKLFKKYPIGTEVQVALSNKNLVSMFERMNFKKVVWIEFWGETTNTVKMDGRILENTIRKLYENEL
jgi:hypothetical protein